MANIAIFGANGTLGSRIASEALNRGHNVTAIVRSPEKMADADSRITVKQGDVLDPQSVAAAAQGQDVVVSAVGGGDGPGHLATIAPAAKSLVEGLRSLGDNQPRLFTVGGAGSLRTPDGKQVWDNPELPEFLLQIMRAHGDALDFLKGVDDVEWVNLSPAGGIAPGERTGTYRVAEEDLVINESGESFITAEDYAVAVIDEIENKKFSKKRFTVGS